MTFSRYRIVTSDTRTSDVRGDDATGSDVGEKRVVDMASPVEDFSGVIPAALDSTLEFENNAGFAHIGYRIIIPTGGSVIIEGTFDGTTWFSVSIRGIESNIFISTVDSDANMIGSIVGLKKFRFRTLTAGSADGSVSGRMQFQQSTIEGLEHQNDIDLGKIITEVQSSQLTYVGRADTDVQTSEAKWQIKRILTQGNATTIEFAAQGQYNQIWDNREDLFEAPVLSNPASLAFDGVDEYITLGDNYDFGPATAFSWSMWINANNLSAQRTFISKTTQDANVYGYSFQHTAIGRLFVQMRAPGSLASHTYSATSTLSPLTWYHVCFTYAGGSNQNGMLAYLNGVVEPAPASFPLNAWDHTDPLMFARRGTTQHFSGNMNHISVWNKALTQAEVTELHNSGAPGDLNSHSAVANLLSWWPLNDDSTFPTEADINGTINGTLINMEIDDYDVGNVP